MTNNDNMVYKLGFFLQLIYHRMDSDGTIKNSFTVLILTLTNGHILNFTSDQ